MDNDMIKHLPSQRMKAMADEITALRARLEAVEKERRTLIAALKDGGDIQRLAIARAERAEAALATARRENDNG